MAAVVALCAGLAAGWCVAGGAAVAWAAEPLPSFGEEGEAAGQFEHPRGVAVDQETGQIYVVDSRNLRVERWSGEGAFERTWGREVNRETHGDVCLASEACVAGEPGTGAGEFGGFPKGVAVDNSLGLTHGNVYVIDDPHRRVEEFSAEGEFVLMFGKGVNANTHGNICTAAEREACQAGEEGTGPGEFAALEGNVIAVDAFGRVYVGDTNRVQEFDSNGVFEGEVSLPGVGQIIGLAVDSARDLYVVASGLSGVHKYDLAGAEAGEPRDPEVSANGTVITVGPADELFVDGSSSHQHVQEYDAAGAEVASLVQETSPEGITFANELGVLYVLLSTEVRVLAPPPPGPVVVEGSEHVDNVLPTSADAHALVNPEGAATEYHVEYGRTTGYGESTAVSAPLTAVNDVQSVTVKASGGSFTLAFEGEATGEIPFIATAGEVQTALEGIAKLGAGQVTVSGEPGGPWSIEFTGSRAGEDVAELTAEAGALTGEKPSATVATSTPGFSLFDDRAASAAIEGLQPGTVYHYRFVATDGSHTTFGPDMTFESAPPVSIEDESVSQVTADSAQLEAVLNAHGLPSEFHFEYGTSSEYGSSAPVPDGEVGSSSEGASVHVQIEGLAPQTVYHYRVVAHNSLNKPGEVVASPDRTFTTSGAPVTTLADRRQWEMVSPPDKHGSALEAIAEEGAVIQAAEDGHAITYVAKAPVESEREGEVEGEAPGSRSVANTQLLSTRKGPDTWKTDDITTKHEEVASLAVGNLSEYQLFSPNLSMGIVEPAGATPLNPDLMGERKERTPYRRESDGTYVPLVTEANTPPGVKFGGNEFRPGVVEGGILFVSATPDAEKIILASPQPLVKGVSPAEGGAHNLYEWKEGKLDLVSVMPSGRAASEEPVGVVGLGMANTQVRGAVSATGERVVFETDSQHLYLRDLGRRETVQLDLPQAGVKPGAGQAQFQIATADGSRVFFTDAARLTPDSTAKEIEGGQRDLYMCEATVVEGHLTCKLTDLTVDRNRNEAAAVQGDVIGIDESGRYVYFVANGALAPGATHGDCQEHEVAPSATCNIYVRDLQTESTALVAVVANSDRADWQAEPNGANLAEMTAGVSGNGRFVAFMSSRPLTGYDNRDAVTGERDVEVYEFDRERGTLVCASCDASGARPVGVFDPPEFPGLLVDRPRVWAGQRLAGSIPGWSREELPHALYRSRYLLNTGRLFFNSPVGLVSGDSNGHEDVYELEASGIGGCDLASGCVALMSSGASAQESAFLDATSSGEDVFFLTGAQLAPQDVDGALDVYDAHVCSSGAPCASSAPGAPPPCTTADSCRAASPAQPDVFGAPASQLFSGTGNVGPTVALKPKPLTRAQKLARALRACAHRPRRKRAACRRQARKLYGPVATAKKHARRPGRTSRRGR